MIDLMIPLDMASKEPLYEQIYAYIKEEIKKGSLPCHGRLPSTRMLAKHMQLSRSTVDMAYGQLTAEGYIEAIPCKGYYVAEIDALYVTEIKGRAGERQTCGETGYPYDFSPRGVDLEHFPYNVWRKITKNTLTDDSKELFQTGNHKGEETLRQAICDYLHQGRGVKCIARQVIIGAGNEYLLLLLHQLFSNCEVVAMENPTYKQAYRVFKSLGHTVVPVTMDAYGMEVASLRQTGASLAYVMPSHQFPLGIVMPVKRRLELLGWAKEENNRYIIEDDYDSEFRYKGKPIPALQGFDTEEKVIYMGTFSKAVAPAIRVSYLVLPKGLLRQYEEKLSFYSSTVSRIDQTVIETFLRDGYFERHLNRMRAIYKTKHDLMLNELRKLSGFTVSGEHAGIHILLTSKRPIKEETLIQRAKEQGVRVYGLSDYYIEEDLQTEYATVILGYANMDENDIIQGIQRLILAWR